MFTTQKSNVESRRSSERPYGDKLEISSLMKNGEKRFGNLYLQGPNQHQKQQIADRANSALKIVDSYKDKQTSESNTDSFVSDKSLDNSMDKKLTAIKYSMPDLPH